MRKKKAFLSTAALAATGLLAAAPAMAQATTPSAVCYAAGNKVEAFGPSFVPCPNPTADGPECTEILYKVYGGPSNVATVVSSLSTDPDYLTSSIVKVEGGSGNGNLKFLPCVGDNLTALGARACHEEAARINPTGSIAEFKITVKGKREGTPKTVVTKKGNTIGACEIVGLGEVGTAVRNPFETVLRTETLRFKGCAVTFDYDLATGEVVNAALDPSASEKPVCSGGEPDGSCCEFDVQDVTSLELKLNGVSLGNGKFGSGYVSSGENSCTTRVIGGRVYTWGSPCP